MATKEEKKKSEFQKKYRGLLGDGEDEYIDYDGIQSLIQENEKLKAEVKRLRLAFITAVRHVGEYNISIDDLFDIIDEDLVKMYQKHHNDDE